MCVIIIKTLSSENNRNMNLPISISKSDLITRSGMFKDLLTEYPDLEKMEIEVEVSSEYESDLVEDIMIVLSIDNRHALRTFFKSLDIKRLLCLRYLMENWQIDTTDISDFCPTTAHFKI